MKSVDNFLTLCYPDSRNASGPATAGREERGTGMLDIAICDDEPEFCTLVEEYCQRLGEELGLAVNTVCYHDADACLQGAPQADILFLDIQLGTDSGMETARKLRGAGNGLAIVFMTNYLQYAVEGYSVQAYRYLLKPIAYAQFRSEIADLFRSEERKKDTGLQVNTQDGIFTLRREDILYVETVYGKKVLIHTHGRVIEQYSSITAWEEKLGSGFYRVHNSYLVNLSEIAGITHDRLTLRSGEAVPVSKYRKKDFMNIYTKYLGNRL